jgi:aspartate aminotransferase
LTGRYQPIHLSGVARRGLKPSATLLMNERVREMRAAGQDVYHLGFGESRFPVHAKVATALQDNAQQRSYLPVLGLPELRESIAEFYQRRFRMTVSPDQVVTGPGSKSLLYALLLALGEEVILPRPSWVTYGPQAQILGKPVLSVPMRPECGYQLEVPALRQAMEEDEEKWGSPDVLVLNSPHNPTGTMLLPGTVQALADFARQEQLMVLSDEVYALTAHGTIPHRSVALDYPEGTIVLGGLSKHLSLGGWRVGVAILPAGRAGEALSRTLGIIAGSIWSCVAAPVQYAALVAYSNDAEIDEYVDLCADMHAARTRYLYERLTGAGIGCVEPSGGFYLFPNLNRWREALGARGVGTCEDLATYLLERYELATLPGSAFGCRPGDLSLRLSSSYLDAGTDEQAANLVEAFVQDPDPQRFIEGPHPRLREAANRLVELAADLERDQARDLKGESRGCPQESMLTTEHPSVAAR